MFAFIETYNNNYFTIREWEIDSRFINAALELASEKAPDAPVDKFLTGCELSEEVLEMLSVIATGQANNNNETLYCSNNQLTFGAGCSKSLAAKAYMAAVLN